MKSIDELGTPLTALEEIGEFGLIEKLAEHFVNTDSSILKGIGDDCAVLRKDDRLAWLVTTDLLVEGVHFDLTYSPLKHLGYKAVVVNLSDIYAMNGTPRYITVSIAMSSRFSVEAIEELYSGIHLACQKYNVALIGGDTSSSRGGLLISVTAIGETTVENVVYRHGAKEKEIICVTGDLGAAMAGLQVLEREKRVFKENAAVQPDLTGYEYVVERQLKPEARADVIAALHKLVIVPTSMIDISDGLASEVNHLCRASGVGARVFWEKIPRDFTVDQTAEQMHVEPSVYALHGGEDYELLFTIRQADVEKLKGVPDVTMIGFMEAVGFGVQLVLTDGQFTELKPQGWNHFGS